MKKRILAWLLIFCLLAVPLAGCGDSEDETTPDQVQAEQPDGVQEASPVSLSDCVYQAEYLDLEVDDSYQFQGVEYCCVSGPYLFFCGKCTPAAGQTAYKEMAIFRMDLDSREIIKLDYLEAPEGSVINIMPLCMAAGPDGTFWFGTASSVLTFNSATQLYSVISKDESLRQYDADGQLLKTVPTNGLIDLYIQQFYLDETGNFYLNTNDTVYLLDPDGKQLAKLPHEDVITTLYQLSDAEIGIFYHDVFRLIDPAARELGESIRLPDNASSVYPGIQDYGYLYDIEDSLYGYRAETGESDLLLSWVDCGVNRETLQAVTALEDGRIFAVTKEAISGQYEFVLLTPVDPASVQQQELTLACVTLFSDLRSAIAAFNQAHSDIKIVVKDYSQYNTGDDPSAGLTRLFTEILAGQMPDLLCTTSMPLQQLAAQDMLVDLWPLIDSDEELSRDDLMTHLFDVMSIDGKLYQTASSFRILSAIGNADVIGARTSWTLDELLEAAQTMPDNALILGSRRNKKSAILFCLGMGYDAFIDWETQTCHFDGPEFIKILEFANRFPDEYDLTNSSTAYERFQEGTQLLLLDSITSLQWMQMQSALVGGNPCYVGFPCYSDNARSDGNGNCLSVSGGDVAITTACQNIDAAWSFLRTFLTEEYQREQKRYFTGFPTNRHAFEASVEAEMTEEEEVEGAKSYGTSYEGVTVMLTAATQEDYDLFMQLYAACNNMNNVDDTIYDIIMAEAAPFFAGQKTAEEAAALIQNRIGLYVMEQS